MKMFRRLTLAALLALSAVPAFGQGAPPPVPALPDTERRTSYTISGSNCACAVNFAIYGDSTDYGNWIEVWVNGAFVPSGNYVITSPTGPLGSIPRPITDAVLTFTSPVTGTVQIVGARRPRRVSQFAENRGVAARDVNQVITDIVAMLRENWDKTNDITGRAVLAPPGETLAILPILANRANMGACFDGSGNLTTCVSVPTTTFIAGNGITFTGVNPTTISVLSAANVQTVNYSIQTSDCSKTVAMSGGLKTVTLPAAGGFSSGCEVTVKNNETYTGAATGRGKKMSGFPSDVNAILWPGQSVRVKTVGGVWVTTQIPGRWLLPTTAGLCYRQDGDDTSDGFGNGTVAADCLAHVQKAVTLIGTGWDGTGYNSCNIDLYSGGTNIITESVSQTGQSVGCYITVNMRAALKWTHAQMCWTTGDNAITVFNFNFGPVPTFQCNTSNTPLTGQFYGHQSVIYDIFGSYLWIPGGLNDDFMIMDAYGRGTIGLSGGGMVIGDGLARAANSVLNCDSHCSGLQISGAVGFSANVTLQQTFSLHTQSYINTTAAFSGAPTVANPTTPTGNSVLITNGTTIPGGTATATGGQVCASKC